MRPGAARRNKKRAPEPGRVLVRDEMVGCGKLSGSFVHRSDQSRLLRDISSCRTYQKRVAMLAKRANEAATYWVVW